MIGIFRWEGTYVEMWFLIEFFSKLQKITKKKFTDGNKHADFDIVQRKKLVKLVQTLNLKHPVAKKLWNVDQKALLKTAF